MDKIKLPRIGPSIESLVNTTRPLTKEDFKAWFNKLRVTAKPNQVFQYVEPGFENGAYLKRHFCYACQTKVELFKLKTLLIVLPKPVPQMLDWTPHNEETGTCSVLICENCYKIAKDS